MRLAMIALLSAALATSLACLDESRFEAVRCGSGAPPEGLRCSADGFLVALPDGSCTPLSESEACRGECGSISFMDPCTGVQRTALCPVRCEADAGAPDVSVVRDAEVGPDACDKTALCTPGVCGTLSLACAEGGTIECGGCEESTPCVQNQCTCANPLPPDAFCAAACRDRGACGGLINVESDVCAPASLTSCSCKPSACDGAQGSICLDDACLTPAVLSPPDPSAEPNFGTRLAAWGDLLIIGSQAKDDESAGSIYVYRWNEQMARWEFSSTSSSPIKGDAYPNDIALDGSVNPPVAVLGAPGWSSDTGRVEVRTFGASEEAAWYEPGVGTPPFWIKGFGFSVAVLGDVVVVGAPLSRPDQVDDSWGAIGIYDRDGTTLRNGRTKRSMVREDLLGSDIALTKNALYVASLARRPGAGAVRVFDVPLVQPFDPIEAHESAIRRGEAFYASYVDANARYLASSAANYNASGIEDAGSVSVVARTALGASPDRSEQSETIIDASSAGEVAREKHFFGAELAIDDADRLVVGAPGAALHSGAFFFKVEPRQGGRPVVRHEATFRPHTSGAPRIGLAVSARAGTYAVSYTPQTSTQGDSSRVYVWRAPQR